MLTPEPPALSIDDFYVRYLEPAIKRLAVEKAPAIKRELRRRHISVRAYFAMPKEERDALREDMARVIIQQIKASKK